MRNDLTIYDQAADRWWSDDLRWVRTLKNLVPGRLGWFDRQIDWRGKAVLDLGCAGGFMAEALDARGVCQRCCRLGLVHAARCWWPTMGAPPPALWGSASAPPWPPRRVSGRSGLSETAPTGRQLRVRPDQRAGCFLRAA